MTFEKFADIAESVGATVKVDSTPIVEGGRPHPRVLVTFRDEARTWRRPTFRQAFEEAVDWLRERA